MTATVGVFVSAGTLALGYLGWWAKRRSGATDAAGTLVNAGVALATFEVGQRHECEQELAKVRATLAEHADRLEICDRHRAHDAEVIAMLAAKVGVDLGSLTVED